MDSTDHLFQLSNYALELKRAGEYQAASRIYEFLNNHLPNNPDVFNGWAKTLACMGEYDIAISFFRKAVSFFQEFDMKERCNIHIQNLLEADKNSPEFFEYMKKVSGNPYYTLPDKNIKSLDPINTYTPDLRETILFGGLVKYVGTGRVFSNGYEFISSSFEKNILLVKLDPNYIQSRSNYNIYRRKPNANDMTSPWEFKSESGRIIFYETGRFFEKHDEQQNLIELMTYTECPMMHYIVIKQEDFQKINVCN